MKIVKNNIWSPLRLPELMRICTYVLLLSRVSHLLIKFVTKYPSSLKFILLILITLLTILIWGCTPSGETTLPLIDINEISHPFESGIDPNFMIDRLIKNYESTKNMQSRFEVNWRKKLGKRILTLENPGEALNEEMLRVRKSLQHHYKVEKRHEKKVRKELSLITDWVDNTGENPTPLMKREFYVAQQNLKKVQKEISVLKQLVEDMDMNDE